MQEREPEAAIDRSTANQVRRGSNKWIGRAFVILWVVGVVAVYVVIVKLKVGGERALRLPEEQRVESGETGGITDPATGQTP
ncbi:MAG: hypothetical protein KDA16_03500 [Phycisphaerales bacterium]|nr:hypothetical protein [Phycisphaerales bacterium]